MPELTLFDLEPAPRPELSYTQQLTARRRALLAAGVHPLTRGPLLPIEREKTCGDCAHLFGNRHGRTTYWKCELKLSRGPATDIRKWWPACDRYAEPEAAP